MSKVALMPPDVQPLKLDGLSDWLLENGYHRDSERDVILDIVKRNRTSEVAYMCGFLDREDRELAELVLEESQPEVPYDDPAWFVAPEDFETWELGPAIPPGAVLTPPRGDGWCVVGGGKSPPRSTSSPPHTTRHTPPYAPCPRSPAERLELDTFGDDIPFLVH